MTQTEFDQRMDAHTTAICDDYKALITSQVTAGETPYGRYSACKMCNFFSAEFRVFGLPQKSMEINHGG